MRRATGVTLLAELAAAVRECHEKQLGHMTAEEMQMLVELLKKARDPHEPTDGWH